MAFELKGYFHVHVLTVFYTNSDINTGSCVAGNESQNVVDKPLKAEN